MGKGNKVARKYAKSKEGKTVFEDALIAYFSSMGEYLNEQIKRELTVGQHKGLVEAMRHYPLAGGKRLRPMLAMLVADAVSGNGKKALPFGLCLELLHCSTLIHDDLIDEDEFRRGVKTVHYQYGTPLAIRAGDALFARAFEVLATVDIDKERIKLVTSETAKTIRMIFEGLEMERDYERQNYFSVDKYIQIAKLKTANLLGLATWGGVIIAEGTKKQMSAMRNYGCLLGLGFQIWDDLIDLGMHRIGKPIGNDLKRGKKTFIVSYAIPKFSAIDKKRFFKVFGNPGASVNDLERIIDILEKTGSIEYARNKCHQCVVRAGNSLHVLPPSKYRDLLRMILEFIEAR